MVITEHENMKIAEIWLTRAEQEDATLRQGLQKIYEDYSRRKFKVAQFHSGTGPLYDSTIDLLVFNRKRLAEIENAQEKSFGNPNLSTSYSGVVPVQC